MNIFFKYIFEFTYTNFTLNIFVASKVGPQQEKFGNYSLINSFQISLLTAKIAVI